MELHQLKCVACRSGDPSLTYDEILRWNREIPKWDVKEVAGIKRLERVFTFKDFAEAMDFTIKVARLAEEQKHHPLIITEYGRVTLNWWTHKVNGLHLNDFIMAAKVDGLIRSYPPRG